MANVTFAFKNLAKSGHLEERWNYESRSLLLSPPRIADIDDDGHPEIIFGTKDGKIISITSDGQLKWTFNISEDLSEMELMFLDAETSNSVNATPNIEDINADGKKEIVFGTEQGIIHALSSNGKELWRFKTGGPIRGSPLIQLFANKQVGIVAGSLDKKLYFLSGDGRPYWVYDATDGIESCPAIIVGVEPLIIFGANDGTITALDLKGKKKWSIKTEGKVLAQAAAIKTDEGLRIIIGSSNGTLYCLDENGAILWEFHTAGAIFSRAVVEDINNDNKIEIVFGSCDNCVHTLNLEGKELWNYETDFWVVASPLVADIDEDGKKEIIIGSYDHNIYILDSDGTYLLDYVPGVSGIVGQSGQYGEAMTRRPGKTVGKKIWQYQTDGIVVGCAHIGSSIIVNTESGTINDVIHKKTS